jgi:formyl-CoA transferase/succinyl-CoA--D-citramalate CoA-transferase
VIAANIDPMFRRLCQAMDRPELATDPKFVDHVSRGTHAEELDRTIGEWTKTLDAMALMARLDEFGVVNGPINTIADIVADPHFQQRGMIRRIPDPRFGDLAVPGVAPKLSETPGDVEWLGSKAPGTHNEEIYGGLLGIGSDALQQLRADGVI